MFDDDLFDHLTPRHQHEIVLDGVHIPRESEAPVVLLVKYAGNGSAYWNALIKLKPMPDKTAANERAASLFARLAVTGWKNVSKSGSPVAYTVELGAEVLCKLIRAGRFDKVNEAIGAAMNPDNFSAPKVEVLDLGKG